ncbi:hypothetical protein Tsubulata_028868 [Turnera subulata]|uniref:Signal recognition particle subunit SRP72 n=1 Tax=Turnera subulata TaxID=218843 RepID=A0A9Q0FME9_9ROSI|nr:hypothetical protein Tsubulata_028868 [Turnera subulata]
MAPKPKDRGKTAASPSQPPPPIEDLFTNLNRHIQANEYNQAVKVADQVLSVAPNDEDALRCKVVALIKNDNIEKALSTVASAAILLPDFAHLKAYCLYRQNKLNEALDSLKGVDRNNPEIMLLESQILYRLGKMDACADLNQKLLKSKVESVETNLVAGLVMGGRAAEVQKILEANRIKASSSFELAFNVACSLIEKGNYNDAEQLLLSSRRIGQETLMDDNWAEEEIEIDLAPIAVQLAYVQQHLGNSQVAMGAYTDIINKNLGDDESSLAVAVNNLVALRGAKDVSDSLRKLDRLKDPEAQGFQLSRGLDKLSPKQREAIYANRVLLLLHANKMDQARELVAALSDMFPNSVMPVLLQAAVLVRENKAGRAEEMLGQYAEKFPDKSRIVLLARAQVAAAASHPQIAADSLAKIPDIQHMPATVSTIVALKERAGDIDGASAVFDSAIKWWSNAMTEDNKLNLIMREAASFKVKHGKEEEAARLYEELVKAHGNVEALAGLVSTVAGVDIGKAETYEKKLKPLPGLKGVDVDSLEKTSGAKHVVGASPVAAMETNEEAKKEKPKKKRKRKPRYPKGFDPANPGPPPDPERWLPKRERSSYRPKRKDKRAAQVRGSQGAVAREKLEAAATSSSSSNTKANQASASKAASQTAEQSRPSSKSSRKKSRN